MLLSLPALGISWEWIAVSPLGGRGFAFSLALISEIVSLEWGTSFVTVTPVCSVPAALSRGVLFPPGTMHISQHPGAAERKSSRQPMAIGRDMCRNAGLNRRSSREESSIKTLFRRR